MASPSVRADEGVLGDCLGVSSIVPERDGAAEDFLAVAGPDFQAGGCIADVETTDAFGAAAVREALVRSEGRRGHGRKGRHETGVEAEW
jgi:hypothetical protein